MYRITPYNFLWSHLIVEHLLIKLKFLNIKSFLVSSSVMFKWPSMQICRCRFITVPYKILSLEVSIRFLFGTLIIFNCGFSAKLTCAFLLHENIWDLSELNTPRKKNNTFHIRSDTGLDGTVVNRALSSLHGKSLVIKLTSPLKCKNS